MVVVREKGSQINSSEFESHWMLQICDLVPKPTSNNIYSNYIKLLLQLPAPGLESADGLPRKDY